MKIIFKLFGYLTLFGSVMIGKVIAKGLDLTIEVPRLSVAEYHAPYTAIWLETESPTSSASKTLAIWYDVKKRNDEGQKWLKDLRQWWRKDGRELQLPIDGVSGATRLPGIHQLHFEIGKVPLTQLEPGNYILYVELAREVGGREWVKIPFTWPVDSKSQKSAAGESEIGVITLTLVP